MPVKLVIALIIAVGAYLVLDRLNMIPAALVSKSVVPQRIELAQEAPTAVPVANVEQTALPSTSAARSRGNCIRINLWAWNAQMGLLFANGGVQTTAGSLMEKAGVCVVLNHKEETDQTKADQIKLAEALAQGAAIPADLPHFAIIMGDGAAQYLTDVTKATAKLGDDYRPEIVGAVGYSRGEDTFMGPQEWKDDPNTMKGGLTAGVIGDGDWNLAQFLLANRSIKNNPDPTTYDPDAMNWLSADDVTKATEAFIANTCEDRPVVKDGRKTGEKKHVCVQGLVTWTPGDVSAAKKRGGVVRLISTKENPYQMPAVLIGIHKWNVEHAKDVQALLSAAFAGADQVRNYPAALDRAGLVSRNVYGDQTAEYWVRYYKGVTEKDATGILVDLGGSTVANLGDNLVLFGIADGSGGNSNLFRAAYEGFANIRVKQNPEILKDYPKASRVVNTQFLRALAQTAPVSKPEVQTFEAKASIPTASTVAKKNWNITFETGKSAVDANGQAQLDELYNQLAVGAALQVEVDGHTDNVGNADANKKLSEDRAFAVKSYLESKSSTVFPENRISVRAFGDTAPIAPNTTPDGRAKNRRVTIVLGTKD